ncbi:hypothetical protein HD806DRAFT_495058 [Xylariaceae sp. AK1471]|nr:hypothetical protein HD806DRAFT_495058 [Xylariaceae sp. AK1471]
MSSTFVVRYREIRRDAHDNIVTVKATPKELAEENGITWLLRNTNDKIPYHLCLTNPSLYETVRQSGKEDFATLVETLPPSDTTDLRYRGRPILNTESLKSGLWHFVNGFRTETGICIMCSEEFKKPDLRSACGHSECQKAIVSNSQCCFLPILVIFKSERTPIRAIIMS